MKKEFSVMKWLAFPPVSLALAVAVSYVSVRLFDWEGSVPYLLTSGVVFLISLVLTHYTSSPRKAVRISAFVWKGLAWASLTVSLVYSISIQREVQGARITETGQTEYVKAVASLKSGRAQRDAMSGRGQSAAKSVGELYERAEASLFWILLAEISIALGGLLCTYGLAAVNIADSPQGQSAGNPQQSAGSPHGQSALPQLSVSMAQPIAAAPLRARAQAIAPIASGRGQFLRFLISGNGYALHFREGRAASEHICHVSVPEAQILRTMNFDDAARWAIEKREASHGGADAMVLKLKGALL